MPQLVQLVILGVVQGLTEFLPVSSSAHLVFAEYFLGVERPGLLLEGILHLGTVVAIVALFWRDLGRLAVGLARSLARRPDPYGRVAWTIVLATAITGVVGLALEGTFAPMFASARDTAIQLLLNGVILVLAVPRGVRTAEQVTAGDGVAVGLAQAVSIVPGISRSGATIAAGIWRGVSREEAARYSFLAAAPAITAAGLFTLRDAPAAGALGYTSLDLAAGFAASALAGIAAIRWLVALIRRGRLLWFAYYSWAAGVAMLLVVAVRGA